MESSGAAGDSVVGVYHGAVGVATGVGDVRGGGSENNLKLAYAGMAIPSVLLLKS